MAALGEFEQVVMFTVLRLGQCAYGLAVRDAIERDSGHPVSPGAVYTTLGRLSRRGFIRCEAPASVCERTRVKKVYALTSLGARELVESRQRIERVARGLSGSLSRLADQTVG